MKKNIHKRYEVTYWESDNGHGMVESFDTYSDVMSYIKTIPKSKYDTVRVQETVNLYIKGKLVL